MKIRCIDGSFLLPARVGISLLRGQLYVYAPNSAPRFRHLDLRILRCDIWTCFYSYKFEMNRNMAFNSSKLGIVIIMNTLGLYSSMADHQLDSSHSGDQFDIIYASTP